MEFMQDTSTAALKKRTRMESLKQMEDSGEKKEPFGKRKVKAVDALATNVEKKVDEVVRSVGGKGGDSKTKVDS